MKLAVALGGIGLLVGFLVGRGSGPAEAVEAPPPVVKSERKLRGSRPSLADRRSERSAGRELIRAVDPFSRSSNQDFVKVALARWYELAGESVLEWIASEPDLLEGRQTMETIGALVVDGYRRDPGRSFELMKRYLTRFPKSSWEGSEWTYQLGRWSPNFESEMTELMSLVESGKLSVVDDQDPFADETKPSWQSFIQGMLDAGREIEVRRFLETHHPDSLTVLSNVENERQFKTLHSQGWAAMKAAIDRGELEGSFTNRRSVFENWAAEDSQAAVDWYLSERGSDEVRSNQILSVVQSPGFSRSTETYDSRINLKRTRAFLKKWMPKANRQELAGIIWRECWRFGTSGMNSRRSMEQ